MELRFPHSLAVCAIVRNEGKFIREWLEWHIMMGVSKFYLYDNDSDDDTAAVLRPFVKKGIVEYIFYPGKYRQIPAYNDCVTKHKYDCEWLAVIDADEFLQPLGQENVLDMLRRMKKENANMGGLAVNWRLFGSNGHVSSQEGVVSSYTKRAVDEYQTHNHIKSIVNPRCVRCFLSAHYPVYYQGFDALDEQGFKVMAHLSSTGCQTLQHICLAHYCMKSWEDWQKRRMLGKADAPGEYDISRGAFESKDAQLNDIEDDSLLLMRERILESNGGVFRIAREAPAKLEELEKILHEVLLNYESFDLEQLLALYHIYCSNSTDECTGRGRFDDFIISLMHLYLSSSEVLRPRDYDMLMDEIRNQPNLYRGRGILARDLARFRGTIRNYKLTRTMFDYDLYIDRLIASREADYRPRVAMVLPDLADSEENHSGLLMAQMLLEADMEVVLYVAGDGVMRQSVVDMGVTIIADAGLLERSLSNTSWYGGCDLVCLNGSRCFKLLQGHNAPVYRPVFWWIGDDMPAMLEQETVREYIGGLDWCMVTTLTTSQEIGEALSRVNDAIAISGTVPYPVREHERAFKNSIMPLMEKLVHLGISKRIPFEEGVH